MISGFDAPGPRSSFASPPSLREPILQRWSDPTCGKNWRRRLLGGMTLFRENVAYMERSFRQGAEMTRWCGDEFGWDVLMVVNCGMETCVPLIRAESSLSGRLRA